MQFMQVASTSALSLVGTQPPCPCSSVRLSFFHQGVAINPGLVAFQSKNQNLESGRLLKATQLLVGEAEI